MKQPILSLLFLFESTKFDLSSTDVENATNQFTNIMTEEAKRSLKYSSQNRSKRKPITKKWFDYDCKTLRSSLKKLSNKKHRNPLDTELRKEYHVQNKTFKKLIKQKKQQFVDSKINELISNENNRKFWDTLKSMNENNLSYNNNENPTNKLYDHFKTLHSAPDPNTLSAFQINVLDDKKRLEDSNHLQSELDNPIWIEEIDKVIKKLKNKKTARLDGICNEMVKTSSRFIRYTLERLFNLILQSGIFPTSCSNGIITTLHKSGNKNDKKSKARRVSSNGQD